MQFLRSSSKTIQFEAFHVFKIFAANPQKKPRVTRILYKKIRVCFFICDLSTTQLDASYKIIRLSVAVVCILVLVLWLLSSSRICLFSLGKKKSHNRHQNRAKLIQFLDTFLVPERSMDQQFLQDKGTVIQKLKMLQLPDETQPAS